ncbi:hypothetical protein IMZ11_11875 [Microtetraspora sp. AC03309]|nr:hypothetical protein [Microtetraspora sp. AC03309]
MYEPSVFPTARARDAATRTPEGVRKERPALWISSEAPYETRERAATTQTAEFEIAEAGRLEFFDRPAERPAVQDTSSKVSSRPWA